MSIKRKIPLIFSILVFFILVANNSFHFIRSKEALLEFNDQEIKLITQEVSSQVEMAKEGSLYVENLIARELRTVSIAIQNSLPPKHEDVTNEQLKKLAKELMVSHITLLAKTKDDIIGVKSSDPHEINLSTKEWGYWYDAFQQLFNLKPVTVEEGLTLPNYWSGPIDVSSSNPNNLDKWGYYYDGSTDYIIDPYLSDNDVLEYEKQFGPGKIIDHFVEKLEGVLELTVFNPKRFGKEKIFTNQNGYSFTIVSDKPIWYGTYIFNNELQDAEFVEKAIRTGKIQSYSNQSNGKFIKKTFVPIKANGNSDPYVIGVVYDNGLISKQLNRELKEHLLLSSSFLIIVLMFSFIFSRSITNPIGKIVAHVNEIAQGNFGKKLILKRKDELGLLTQNINALSNNLQTYMYDIKQSKELIEYQAFHDPLTGLPNRRYLQKKLKEWMEESNLTHEKVSVLFFDLDRFKIINDSMGHSKGDELLLQVTNRIKESLSFDNCFISRQGGDEFILLLKGHEIDVVMKEVEKIVFEMRLPYYLSQNEIYLGVSCGISVFPQHGENIDVLIASSDMAMYAAKKMGGNRVVLFNEEMRKATNERPLIESKLRKAIEEEQMDIYYQPKVKADTNSIVGVEALLRWNHPELGYVTPDTFIPIAEETGLIQPLWEYAMKKACSQVSVWNKDRREPLNLSVNFSARQFQDPEETVAKVKEILYESRLDPVNFEIEITETILVTNSKEIIIALEELRAYGISISIDDFGTGYSSLSYLKNLPIDILKIDQSFIHDIKADNNNSEIVEAIIRLARSLRLEVIAEGVEEEYQKEFLLQKNCFLMQGYLFSRPLPAEEFIKLQL